MLNISRVEEIIKYKFENRNYIISAMTHKSFAFDKGMEGLDKYNERLEFLGDALLEHAISDYLFSYEPKLKEGVMSRKRAQIVCEDSLYSGIIKLGLDKYINLGLCEIAIDGKKNKAILADMAEAIIAAIYLDSNFEKAKEFVFLLLADVIPNVLKSEDISNDYKTRFQEIAQKNGTVEIKYVLDKSIGKDNEKVFYSSVYLNGKKLGEGVGLTKKSSEQEAAKKAIEALDK